MNSIEAFIALGSNLGDRDAHLNFAVQALSKHLEIVASSKVYETEPVGPVEQGAYLNAVLRVLTTRRSGSG